MKFLIFGACGMAGHTIALFLKEKGHTVLGIDRVKGEHCDIQVLDVRDLDAVRCLVKEGSYDYIINCIGVLNQFAEADKETAVFLNSYFPHFLAKITKESETSIIHMSTDCVFSGEKGEYTENSKYDGETFYDRTKALGELRDNKNITLRNSIIGPDINPNGIGLFNWFMKSGEEINGYTKTMWTGITTLQLAKIMEKAAENKVAGLFNMVYERPISKYDLLQLLNKYFFDNKKAILPEANITVDKSLKRTNFEWDYIVPNYETMISEMSEWISRHKNYYKHYYMENI